MQSWSNKIRLLQKSKRRYWCVFRVWMAHVDKNEGKHGPPWQRCSMEEKLLYKKNSKLMWCLRLEQDIRKSRKAPVQCGLLSVTGWMWEWERGWARRQGTLHLSMKPPLSCIQMCFQLWSCLIGWRQYQRGCPHGNNLLERRRRGEII